MAATKRNFILSSGIGLSADNIYTISSTNSTSIGSGAVIVAGGVGIGSSVSIGGRLQMFNSSNYTAFVSSATGNTVYTLPATSPATGTSVLQSTSAGVLSWVPMTVTGGSAGGAGTVYDGSLNSIPYYPTAGTAITGSSSFTNTGTSINIGYTTAATNSSSGALTIVGGVGIGGSLYVAGDLTINGTTTTINSVTLTVDDKNIELGSVVTPSDVTAEGGGITLRGATDKSINWYTGTGWSSSESWNLASGNTYKINNTTVLSNSSLGTGVTNSYLTALGTITTGVWAGTSITAYYGGTGLQTTFTVGDLLYANTSSTWNRLSPGTNGFILVSAGTANTPAYTNPTTLTIGTATTATNVNVVLASTSASHPLLFTPTSGSASGIAVSSNSTLVYNPSTDILSVSGLAVTSTTASDSITTGALVATGGVGIGGSVSLGGRLQMFNAANYTAFVSSATGNTVYTLPATSPATGSSVLQSTSGGVMSWVPMASGSSSGTVNSGTANFAAYYASTSTAVSENANLQFTGTGLSVGGNINSTSTKSGAFYVNGGLGVTGNAFIGGTTTIQATSNSISATSGALVVSGGAGIAQSVSIGGRLQLFNSSNYTAFVSSATGNTVYTLPATSPATGSSVLQSTSGGLLSWVPMASGSATPGGVLDGSVQYKSGSGFAGTRDLWYDQTYKSFRLGNFPGEEITNNNSAALLIEQAIGSFNGAFAGNLIGVNALSSFTGDLINLQTNAVTRFRVGADGGMGVSSLSSSGNVVITSTTNSTSTTTGALVVTGGMGIGGNAFIGGTTTITNTTTSVSSSTGALVVSGGVGIGGTLNVGADLGISGLTTLTYTSEKLNTKTSATGTVTHDLSTGSVFYHSSISNNFTANFTNVPTTNDRALGVTLILAQGGTPYMSTALQIDGSAQTIKWVNNITPTGTANKVDIVGFSLIRTGSAWTVLGQYSTYG